ncbi:MAG: UvrD-helicase domain-containing protein [Pseudoflavonifractor sp.]|nr:UvrD-helicase domain-containing protein [Alloprevotella sp.]MCM1116329.1 UvrD-helicase domain-containing protein [Pseudoflavonifractor sp.]
MEEYLSHLNDQQRAAVEYVGGPALVIAGAGSGKTRVLTYKIVHLLALGFEPWRILALTFTNKAAREMRERIQQLVGPRTAASLWMGTFHSIFARILRANADRIGFKSSFTIYDTADSKSLIKMIVKEMGLDDKIYTVSAMMSAISTAKNALVSPERYASLPDIMKADRDARRPDTYAVYRNYRDRCFKANAMDFDDLLYYTNILLRDNPDLLRHYQEYFRYILVDEYQDTNFAQHVIVSQLAADHHNLCVVGDDAQSIYSFRGANIRNILNLKQSYPDLQIFKLERNYRSTRNIIGAANSLIDKNTEQIRKNVYSMGDEGSRIEVVQSYSDYEESFLVANRLSSLHNEGRASWQETAILYRTNAQSRILEESLRKRNIPYRIYGGLSFYQRKEIKDAIAYFRLAVNPDDDEALRRIVNFPARGIGETTMARLSRYAADHDASLWSVITGQGGNTLDAGITPAARRKIDDFRAMIDGFIAMQAGGSDAMAVASAIIERTGLLSMLKSERTPESVSKQENLSELLAGVKQFVDQKIEEGLADRTSLSDFLSDVSLATDQDKDETAGEDRVTLMTVHSAKGLEFDNVFVVGVEDDLFPSSMSKSSVEEIEEERRLLYVAITRARNFCMLSFATSRFRYGQTVITRPSPFLRDIDPAYLQLMNGSSIAPPASPRSYGSPTRVDSFRRSTDYRSPRPLKPSDAPAPAPTPPRFVATAGAPGSDMSVHQAYELSEGMEIEHSLLGLGTILAVQTGLPGGDRVKVEFRASGEEKNLLLKFAKFRILS